MFSRLKTVSAVLIIFCIFLSVVAYFSVRLSLPQLDGVIDSSGGVKEPASLSRDALGTAIIKADSRADAAYALGFAHGQDRFFQLDLQRRFAAGELAELFGVRALPHDKEYRIHQLRKVAQDIIKNLSSEHAELLNRYAKGVNDGVGSLSVKPFEYLMLRAEPELWIPEDSVLISGFMFAQMTSKTVQRDYARDLLLRSGGEALLDFLQPEGTQWDTAIDGTLEVPASIPTAEQWALNQTAIPEGGHDGDLGPMNGSNSWAVTGRVTDHGGALLANDPHLAFSLPHIWYRAHISYRSASGEPVQLMGVSLPGLPAIAIGSNGRLAWGMTNSAGDWADLISVEVVDGQYMTSQGLKPLVVETEVIDVAHAESVAIEVRKTKWGPLTELNGETFAYRWLAQFQEALNIVKFIDLDEAKTVGESITRVQGSGISPFNFLVADDQGDIGWTIAGRMPKRGSQQTDRVITWSAADDTWQGWLPVSDYPSKVRTPKDEAEEPYIWTANNRIVGGEGHKKIGVGQYELGTRGWLIEQDLKAESSFDESLMARMVMNNKAVLLGSWQQYLSNLLAGIEVLTEDQKQVKDIVDNWSGLAVSSDAGYTLVRQFREQFKSEVNRAVMAKIFAQGIVSDTEEFAELSLMNRQSEAALLQLRDQQPEHWLPKNVESWREWSLAMLDVAVGDLKSEHGSLQEATWGAHNRLSMSHPMARSLPDALSRFLSMPATPLDGDSNMPLAQHPKQGQSMRLIVAPGREENASMTLPAGQSGHPLSPYFDAGHEDWVKGLQTPLLPGPIEYSLELIP